MRIAFVGQTVWLDNCAPTAPVHSLDVERFVIGVDTDPERALADMCRFRPDVTVVFDPVGLFLEADRSVLSPPALRLVPGVTLGVLVGGLPEGDAARRVGELDRLVSFDPALTGARVGEAEVMCAIAPPVSDILFGEVRPLHCAPRAMSLGRSSEHREAMLTPTKHDHDLLQVIHGVSGARLAELLGGYDVGVYVPREPGGRFGVQVGMHLAAGHLLLSEPLEPEHGLERGIDYLQFASPGGLVWALNRLGRYPEMYQRIRVRGRLKAEQYRASRLFSRLAHDLLLDVAAFGVRSGVVS